MTENENRPIDMTLDERIEEWLDWMPDGFDHQLVEDMKDELAALKAENERLRKLLESFAEVAPGNDYYKLSTGMTAGELRTALETAVTEP